MTRILIIDDEEDIISNIRDLLEINGYEVITANDGETGIKMVLSSNPDLIICDINMPVMTGLEMIAELRKYPEFYTIPFLFLTANANSESVRQGMRLGADDYLTKPYKSSELIKAVELRLRKSEKMKNSILSKLDDVQKSISSSLPERLQKPLKAIVSYSKLLQGNSAEFNSSDIENFIGDIQSSGERLLHLVENYNLYNKLLSNQITDDEINKNLVDKPSEIIKSVSQEAASDYSQNNPLVYDLISNIPISISKNFLTKIIYELTDNAIKFSYPSKPVKIVSIVSNSYYIINFTNFGRGMERDEIKNIDGFIQFKRDTYEQQGIGLGLIIVKKLLELSGGRLSIESVPNDYITIRVFIPVRL